MWKKKLNTCASLFGIPFPLILVHPNQERKCVKMVPFFFFFFLGSKNNNKKKEYQYFDGNIRTVLHPTSGRKGEFAVGQISARYRKLFPNLRRVTGNGLFALVVLVRLFPSPCLWWFTLGGGPFQLAWRGKIAHRSRADSPFPPSAGPAKPNRFDRLHSQVGLVHGRIIRFLFPVVGKFAAKGALKETDCNSRGRAFGAIDNALHRFRFDWVVIFVHKGNV